MSTCLPRNMRLDLSTSGLALAGPRRLQLLSSLAASFLMGSPREGIATYPSFLHVSAFFVFLLLSFYSFYTLFFRLEWDSRPSYLIA